MLRKKIEKIVKIAIVGGLLIISIIGSTAQSVSAAIKPFELKENSINYHQKQYTIVLDSGHDYNDKDYVYKEGLDTGAIGAGGLQESNINERIAKTIKKELESKGVKVILTKDKVNVRTSLGERIRKGNNTKNADAYVSIHNNANKDRKIVGTEVFYNKYGQPLAKEICKPLADQLNTENRGVKESPYYINNIEKPAVLLECGFITNKEEMEKVDKPETGKNIANSIFRYLNKLK